MDLRTYYQNIRTTEGTFEDTYPIIISKDTGDGGKSGNATEVTKRIAAKFIVEGRARQATPEEAAAFRQTRAEAIKAAEQLAAAGRLQVTVLSTAELNRLKSGSKASRE